MVKNNLKSGIKCVIVGNNSRHNREIGSVVTINGPYNNQGYTTREFGGTYFAYNDLELYQPSKEDLMEQYSELKDQMRSIKSKIDFLNKKNKESLILKEYKEHLLGKVLDSPRGDNEDKSKAILEIVESVDGAFYGKSDTLKVIKLPSIEDVEEELEKEEIEVETEEGDLLGGPQDLVN